MRLLANTSGEWKVVGTNERQRRSQIAPLLRFCLAVDKARRNNIIQKAKLSI